jgi:hypothetical protein
VVFSPHCGIGQCLPACHPLGALTQLLKQALGSDHWFLLPRITFVVFPSHHSSVTRAHYFVWRFRLVAVIALAFPEAEQAENASLPD